MNEQDAFTNATTYTKPKIAIGCIVHYTGLAGGCRPAIITHVWSQETVNLSVFQDRSYMQPEDILLPISVVHDLSYGWHWPDECAQERNP